MCVPQRHKSTSPLRFLRNNGGGDDKRKMMSSTSISQPFTNQLNLIIKNKKIDQADSFELNLIELCSLCFQLFACFLSNKNRQFPHLKYYLTLFCICLLSYSTALNPNSEFVHDDLVAIVRNPDVFDSPLSKLFMNDFWGTPMSTATSHKSYRPFTVLTFRMLKSYKSSQLMICLQFTCTSTLALLSKETGITILPICIGHFIYTFYFIERVHSSNNRTLTLKQTYQSKSSTVKSKNYFTQIISIPNKNYPLVLSVLLLTSLLSFRIWMLNGQLPIFTSQDNPAAFASSQLTRFLTFAYLMAFNFVLLLFPSTLSYDWQMNSIALVEQLSDSRNLITLTVCLLLVGLSYSAIRNKNKSTQSIFYFGLVFLIIPHLPASNLFVTVGFVVAERTLYIPSIGFSALFALGFIQLKNHLKCQMHWSTNRKQHKKCLQNMIYIVLVLMFTKTLIRNSDWLTRESLFKSGLRDLSHNAKIQYNFANLQKDLGNAQIAIHHYRLALRYWPNHESAHNNLAVLLDNDLNEAEQHLIKTLDLNPYHSKAYFNLANIYSKRQNHQYAISLLKKAIELNPDFAEAYSKLGSEFVNSKEFRIANEYHQYAIKLQPRNADFLNNYGVYLNQIGQSDKAIEMYRRALLYNNTHKKARDNLDQLINSEKSNLKKVRSA